MNNCFDKFMNIYAELYKQTCHIRDLLNKEESAVEVEAAVVERASLVEAMGQILSDIDYTEQQKTYINNALKKIKDLEAQNMAVMTEKHADLKKAMNQNKINNKMALAYRIKLTKDPVIFDSRE
ncbi:MAG: hypothetical protein WCK67_07340 [bacterium]